MTWARMESYPMNDQDAQLGQRLHEEGLVYAINRLVLHPVGLALGTSGAMTDRHQTVTGLALFSSDDPEGIVFADDGQHERGMAKLTKAGHTDLLAAVRALDVVDAEVIDEDSAAECSRLEADMREIHTALIDVGLDGAINADSIIERIRQLAPAKPSGGAIFSDAESLAQHERDRTEPDDSDPTTGPDPLPPEYQ